MIEYVSTRDCGENKKKYSSAEAIKMGLAPDGGLFVPRGHSAHRVNRHLTGHFARQMAAHAVCDDKNAAFFIKPGRILILFAFSADIGAHRRRHAVHSRRFQVSQFRLLSLI